MPLLVLEGRLEEEFVIGLPTAPICTVKVTELWASRVKLGFDCPRDVEVNRLKVARRKAHALPAAARWSWARSPAISGAVVLFKDDARDAEAAVYDAFTARPMVMVIRRMDPHGLASLLQVVREAPWMTFAPAVPSG